MKRSVLIFISFFVIRPECMGVRIYAKCVYNFELNDDRTLHSLLDRMERYTYFLFETFYGYSTQFISAQRLKIFIRTHDLIDQMSDSFI